MSKKLKIHKTNTNLWYSLIDELGLTSGKYEEFPLLGGLQLTLETTPLIFTPQVITTDRTITAVGWKYQFLLVPDDKAYLVYGIDLQMDDGNTTISKVSAYSNPDYYTINKTAGKTAYFHEFNPPLFMSPDTITEFAVYCDAHVGDSNWGMDAYCLVIDRRSD